jgi:2-(1,2-epoxy-1,2-dihydrophenyl)acetyl-CoA isomerase
MSAPTEFGHGTVQFETRGPVGTVWLNRPQALNAVVPELVDGLCESLGEAVRQELGAVVLRGRGRAFCAGFDLKVDQGTSDLGELGARIERIQDVTRAVQAAPFPVIAAVHGYAVGAGCEFALCSDLVVADTDAQFGFPEVGVGLSVTGGISQFLPMAVGHVVAKELILLGERFTSARAQQLGLINRVVEPSSLEAAAYEWAEALASRPRLALQLAKKVLDTNAPGDLTATFEVERGHAIATQMSSDAEKAHYEFSARHAAAETAP